ncbi:MAG: tripartite tricarboxylate transporter TctB family protein [Saprospiraceae bacterium]
MKINKAETLNGMLLLLFGAWIWWQSASFPNLEEGYPGPALFPRMISIGLMLSGILLLVTMAKSEEVVIEKSALQSGLLRFGGGIGLVALYPLVHPYLGFIPTLGIICMGIGLLLGIRPWVAAVSTVGTVLFIFLTFDKLLGVSL